MLISTASLTRWKGMGSGPQPIPHPLNEVLAPAFRRARRSGFDHDRPYCQRI
jgi:hypothetical protein